MTTYEIDLGRIRRNKSVTLIKGNAIQDLSGQERHMIDMAKKEMHLSVIEPHSHDIVAIPAHSHDIATLPEHHAVALIDKKSQQITTTTDRLPSVMTPEEAPTTDKRKRTYTKRVKREVAAE